jgi:hypothetical protein
VVLKAERGQPLVRLTAQFFSAKRPYFPTSSEKLYVVGQTYRLIKATVASGEKRRPAGVPGLPEDSIAAR